MTEEEQEEGFVPRQEAVILSEYNRRQLARFGIFTGMLLALFALLVFFALISRQPWERGLRTQVEQVLARSGSGVYTVGDMEPLGSPFAVSCASYRLGGDATGHAVIIRVATMYGPLPAVFLYREGDAAADFVAFAAPLGKAEKAVEHISRHSQLAYWGRRVPQLLGMPAHSGAGLEEEVPAHEED